MTLIVEEALWLHTRTQLPWEEKLPLINSSPDNEDSRSTFKRHRLSNLRSSIRKSVKRNNGRLTHAMCLIRDKVGHPRPPSNEQVREWETTFSSLLNNKYGLMLLTQFLQKEHSQENIEFWLKCQEFKKIKDGKKIIEEKAHEIYQEFIAVDAPKEVNLESNIRAITKASMENRCGIDTFIHAEEKIVQLMEKDSYTRFLKDKLFLSLRPREDEEKGKSPDA